MKFLAPALLAVLAAPVTVVPISPAVAQTAADCEAQLASLRTAVSGLTITAKNADKERAGLMATLNAASTELAKGKNADAAKKLADFKVKVAQLLEAGRISSADAGTLTTQADAAIACINGLTTTS